MKYEIKNRWDGSTIYQDEADSFSALVQAAIKAKADLQSADLRSADLQSANLLSANLPSANLQSIKSGDLAFAQTSFFFFNDTATTEIYTLSYTTLFRL